MLKKFRTKQRHSRLMRVVDQLVFCQMEEEATPAQVIALAFGRHQLRITEDEAAEYLDAGLVRRGHKPRPAPASH